MINGQEREQLSESVASQSQGSQTTIVAVCKCLHIFFKTWIIFCCRKYSCCNSPENVNIFSIQVSICHTISYFPDFCRNPVNRIGASSSAHEYNVWIELQSFFLFLLYIFMVFFAVVVHISFCLFFFFTSCQWWTCTGQWHILGGEHGGWLVAALFHSENRKTLCNIKLR